MARSWFRSVLLAPFTEPISSRSGCLAYADVRRSTRSLVVEKLDARCLLASDVLSGPQWGASCLSPDGSTFATSETSLTSKDFHSQATALLTTPLTPAATTMPPLPPPPPPTPPITTMPSIGIPDPGPSTPPEITIQVYDTSGKRLVTEVSEGSGISVAITLSGGTRSANTYVNVTADVNFDGMIDGEGVFQERGILRATSSDGRFWHTFMLPDDGPWPGNGTISDKLTIRASYGNTVKTAEVTINNVAPRIFSQPTFSLFKDATGTSVARVRVQVADVGIHDVHTAVVKWSDGQTTSSQNATNINSSCGPAGGRSIVIERRLLAGESVVPTEVQVKDDDSGSAAGGDGTATVKMLRMDVALNDDDDNQSKQADLTENPVIGEDDVRSVDLTPLLSPQMSTANGTFIFSYNPATIRVWDSADKQRLILPQTNMQLSPGMFNGISTIPYSGQQQVFVEGIAAGQSSITLSWLPAEPLQQAPFPICQPPSLAIFGGAIEVYVWMIDLDIDSDNDNGFDSPESDPWEEYLEDNEYGIGKMIFPNASEFTQVRLILPKGLASNDPTIRIKLEATGSRTGETMIWNTYKNDPNRVDKWLLPSTTKPYVGNKIALGKSYSLDQLNYSWSKGEITLFLEALTVKFGNETKVLVDDVGRDIDILKASVVGIEIENVSDLIQWKNVLPGDFYPSLNNGQDIRNAIASDAVYGPSDAQPFALKLMSQKEVEDLLSPFVSQYLSSDDFELIMNALFHSPSTPPRPPILALKAALYMDHAGKNGPTYILAFAGTELHDAQDILTNLAQFLEPGESSYFYALHLGGYLGKTPLPLMTTGHSLGGGLASAAAIAGTAVRGVPMPCTTYNGAGLQTHTLLDPTKSPPEEYFPGSIAAFNSSGFITNYTVWQKIHPNASSDAPDVLTLLQNGVPVLPTARGFWVKGEGLYNLTEDETLFLQFVTGQLANWYPDRESMLQLDIYLKARDALTALALKILLSVDPEAIWNKIGASHRMPSVYYSLMHSDGWNVYDRTIVDYDS